MKIIICVRVWLAAAGVCFGVLAAVPVIDVGPSPETDPAAQIRTIGEVDDGRHWC
jgi:hypothetical protein